MSGLGAVFLGLQPRIHLSINAAVLPLPNAITTDPEYNANSPPGGHWFPCRYVCWCPRSFSRKAQVPGAVRQEVSLKDEHLKAPFASRLGSSGNAEIGRFPRSRGDPGGTHASGSKNLPDSRGPRAPGSIANQNFSQRRIPTRPKASFWKKILRRVFGCYLNEGLQNVILLTTSRNGCAHLALV